MAGWGGISEIIEQALEQRRREEEERRRQEAAEALRQQREGERNASPPPRANSSATTALPATMPQQPSFQVGVAEEDRPDFGAPSISVSNTRPTTNTRPTSSIQPMSMNADLMGPFPRAQEPAEEQPSRWRPYFQTPGANQWVTPESPFTPEQARQQQEARNRVFNEQPENETLYNFGQAVQNNVFQAPQRVMDAWEASPESTYLESVMDYRRNLKPEDLPTVFEATTQGINAAGGLFSPNAAIGGLIGAGIGALNRNPYTRPLVANTANLMDIANEPGMFLANAPIPGLGVSASEYISAGGAALTELWRQRGNAVDWITSGALGVPAIRVNLQELPPMFFAAGQAAGQEIAKSQDLRRRVANEDALVQMGLRNLLSGSDSAAATVDTLLNRDARIAALQEQAVQLQGQDPVAAAMLMAEAQQLARMSNMEIVQQNMNPLAEFGYGMVFDITNVLSPAMGLLKFTPEALAASDAGRAIANFSDARAVANLTDAAKAGERLITATADGPKATRDVWKNIITPLQSAGERIADAAWFIANTRTSKADADTNALWIGLARVFNGITDRQDIRSVLEILTTKPQDLVKGIALSQEATDKLAQADGLIRWGAGAVGNNAFTRRLPILMSIRDEFPNLKSLQGSGPVNMYEFLGELAGVIHQASYRVNGLRTPNKLPFGATDVRVRQIGPESAVMDYVGPDGKTIQRSREMPVGEAQRQVDAVKGAMAPGRTAGEVAFDIASLPSDIQRAIMSDLWLGYRPANWIGNALSATTMLFANDAYTLMPVNAMTDDLARKFGGAMPTTRTAKTATGVDVTRGASGARGEVGQGFIGQTAAGVYKLITGNPNNPISTLSEMAYSIPYGKTEIPLPGGLAIPFGEEAFATRAFYVPFSRTLNREVGNSINGTLVPQLQRIPGMTPEMVQKIGELVETAAITGNKAEIINILRAEIGKPTVRNTLKAVGVPPELLSPSAQRELEQLFADAAPHQSERIAREIHRIINNERKRSAEILSTSPMQPGVHDWTDVDTAQEAAWLADSLGADAKRAGVDPAAAAEEAKRIATDYVEAQNAAFQRMHDDLGGAPNEPATWAATMDFWYDVQRAKMDARRVVDEASMRAVQEQTPQAWNDKWNVTKQTYADLTTRLQELTQQYRVALLEQGTTPYNAKYNWWDQVDRYLNWDEEDFFRARQTELGGATLENSAEWQRVIDANREYADNSIYELFGAYQMYPSQGSFDLVRNAMMRQEALGAQAAARRDALLEQMLAGEITPAQYRMARNRLWNAHFDAVAVSNEAFGKVIIRNGLAESTATRLRWTQDGVEYMLVGPGEGGKWRARRADGTGSVETFSVGTSPDERNPFVVPQDVVDDYRRLSGEDVALDDEAERILNEMADLAPEPLRPAPTPASPAGYTMADNVAQLRSMIPAVKPTSNAPTPASPAVAAPARTTPTNDFINAASQFQTQIDIRKKLNWHTAIDESTDTIIFSRSPGGAELARIDLKTEQGLAREPWNQAKVDQAIALIRDRARTAPPPAPTPSPTTPTPPDAPPDAPTAPVAPVPTAPIAPASPAVAVPPVEAAPTPAVAAPARTTPAPAPTATVNQLRDAWRAAGAPINTHFSLPANATVENFDNWLLDTINIDWGTGYTRLDDLTPEQVQAATNALRFNFDPRRMSKQDIVDYYGPQLLDAMSDERIERMSQRELAEVVEEFYELVDETFPPIDVTPTPTPPRTPAPAPAVSVNQIRDAGRAAGIATASETGRGFDNWLLNTINKDLGTAYTRLDDLTPQHAQAAMDALNTRATEMQGFDPRRMTKPQMVERYGPQLRDAGYTDEQIGRMSKRELAEAVQSRPLDLADAPLAPGGLDIADAPLRPGSLDVADEPLGPTPAPQAAPQVMDFEEFSARRGVGSSDYVDPGRHRSSPNVSKRAKQEADNLWLRNSQEWQARRDELRREYDEAVASGKIRPPTRDEQLIATARGNEENPATLAAQRVLAKQGKDWQEPSAPQAAPTPTPAPTPAVPTPPTPAVPKRQRPKAKRDAASAAYEKTVQDTPAQPQKAKNRYDAAYQLMEQIKNEFGFSSGTDASLILSLMISKNQVVYNSRTKTFNFVDDAFRSREAMQRVLDTWNARYIAPEKPPTPARAVEPPTPTFADVPTLPTLPNFSDMSRSQVTAQYGQMLRDAGYQIDAMSVREMERLILVEQYKSLLTQAGFVPERMSTSELRRAVRSRPEYLNYTADAPTPAPTPAPARAVEPPTPAPADVPPTEAAQAAINALIESTSPNVQVFYNGKIVDMGYVTDPPVARLTKKHLEEQFKRAAQRAMVNGATVGYVKMPDGTIFQVNQGSKKAKRLSLDAPAPAASTPTPTPAPARAVEPPTPAPADVPPGESIVPGAVADNVPAKSTLPPDQETAIRAEIQKLEAEIAKWRDKMELATKERNPTRIKVIEQQLVIPQRQLEAEYGKLSGTHRHVPAPPNMDLSTRAALSKEQIQYAVEQLRKIADDMESGAIKTATIEIPGDGLVTVYNAAMARGAAERISKGVPSVPSVTKSLTFGDAPRFPKRSKAEVAQDFAETEHTVSFGNAYAPLGDVKSNIKKGWQGLIDESPWGISDGYMMLRRDKVQPQKSAMFAKMDDRGKGKNTLVKKSKIEDYVSELGKAEQSGQTRVAEFGGVDLNQAEEQIAYYIVDNEVHSFSANRVRIIDQLYEPDVVKINSRDHAIFYKDGELVAALSPFVVKNLPTVDDLRGAMGGDAPNMRTYEFTVPTPEEMLGFQKGESVYDNLRNWIARLRKVGNNTAPQMAEVAQANIRGLNDLEATLLREMPGLLQGAPNELNGFQKLAVLDEVRQWLPQYDNALAQAQEVGNSMVNWIMLNYSDRRNFDTILQMIGIPYHYFWSRMPSRLAMAALTKPELVNFYYEATRAIGLENEQADVPQRLEGTLPGPGNSRVQVKRTLDYAIPGMSYFQPNPFAGEPLDEGELAQWANTWEKWAPGFGPLGSLMIDLASNGQLDGNYGAVLNDLMPIPPSSIYQMATGNMPQQGAPVMGVPTGFGPNEFDPYRAQRAIASIGVEEELGDVLTGYANQVVLNQYNGVPIGTDIPPEMLQAAIDLANRGVRRAAEDRLAGRGSAWATGASVQPYPQSEQEMRQTQNAYFAAGYDPTLNPDGSKALQNAVLDETELPTWWTKNDETPGIDAQLSDLYDEQRRLREEKIEAEQAAVNALDLGSASKDEIYNARTEAGAPYQAQIDANDQRIEQLQGQQTPDTMPNNPNQGMSPAEISTRYVTDVLYDAGRLPGRPEWPGDNASSQAKREYYEAQRRYEAAQQAYVVNALAGPVMSTSDQVREMRGPAQYTEEEAVEVWKNWRNRNKTDGEIQRVAALDAITEANRVQWENRKADVYTTFGDDVGTLYEQYLNLPEGDARAQFKAQNPELRAVGLYTWNPEQYAYLAQTYSPEAIMVWARTPAWEDSEEGRARRSAYYDLHPEAFEINAWLYGRPGSAGEQDITDDDTFSYNFGTDYDQAKQLFGDNIWSVVGGYKRGWDKQTKSAYFDANPQLSGFFDWWYAKLPSSSTASRNEFKTSGYGQRYGTYGGGWSGGGWSGSSSSWGGRDDPAYVRPEQFDQRLMPQLGQLRRWEPTRNNTNWINEGRALEYRRRGKWEPPAFGRTRVL